MKQKHQKYVALKTFHIIGAKNGVLPRQAQKSANDSLQEELEARYGGGFAQWVIDGLEKSGKSI